MPAVSQPVVEVSNLTKRFGDTLAVDGIDFAVSSGTTAALLGGNGAGKTTTLSMLLGLLLPSAGRIRVLGEDMLRHRYRVLPRMNFSSPYVDLPHRLTVRQNLTVYGKLYGLAQLGAVQVWAKSLTDQAGAVAGYRKALALGVKDPRILSHARAIAQHLNAGDTVGQPHPAAAAF